jgi:hypothetical protein
MSTLYVDTINEKTSGNGVQIPGHVVQMQNSFGDTTIAIANSGTGRIYADLLTISYTPISSSNKIVLFGTSGLPLIVPKQ